ncbi:MAG: hypothetical protein ACD_60C00028G0030 [uncultured bacterium]|nr:MAG: hypothetical protein ACD_60C00028G0030 [uncultured bacterium]
MFQDSLYNEGYAVIDFHDCSPLAEIQKVVEASFPCHPTALHQESLSDEERLLLVKQVKDNILKQGLIKKLLLANSDFLVQLLGSDIDIQSDFYLRISRPHVEKDFIDWHRDTFYGNSFWELNFWLPIFPLAEGAGLMVVPGSHFMAAENVRPIEDKDIFRSQVTKGSLANELGYLYASKSDDVIAALQPGQIKLLTPRLGQGILFFAHVAHRAHNASLKTRVSIDLRIKNMFAPTNTKPGYFQPLLRSVMTNCVEKMIKMNLTHA